jgi:hypothetical protein
MGKWSHLVGKLKDKPVDPSYEQALMARVDELMAEEKQTLALNYEDNEQDIADLEKDVKDRKFEQEAILAAMTRKFKDEGLESAVIAGHRWTPVPDPYASVKDRAAFLEWAEQHMRENLQLPWQTLNATVKAALEVGDELPPGVEVFLKRGFKRTKQK